MRCLALLFCLLQPSGSLRSSPLSLEDAPTLSAKDQEWLDLLESPPQEVTAKTDATLAAAAKLADELLSEDVVVPKELDMVCAGAGALSGYFLGAYSVLRELQKHQVTSLKRFAGSSSGGQVAMEIALGGEDDARLPFDVHFAYAHLQGRSSLYKKARHTGPALAYSHWKVLGEWLMKRFAKDALARLNGRAFLSWTRLAHLKEGMLPHNVIAEEYTSLKHASEAFQATGKSPIPMGFEGGWALDGFFTNRVPRFHDRQRKQVVVDLAKAGASGKASMLSAMWNNVESMESMMRAGQEDMAKLLRGGRLSFLGALAAITVEEE